MRLHMQSGGGVGSIPGSSCGRGMQSQFMLILSALSLPLHLWLLLTNGCS